jgi:hypothetical protein
VAINLQLKNYSEYDLFNVISFFLALSFQIYLIVAVIYIIKIHKDVFKRKIIQREII